jgi:hypothetical protein
MPSSSENDNLDGENNLPPTRKKGKEFTYTMFARSRLSLIDEDGFMGDVKNVSPPNLPFALEPHSTGFIISQRSHSYIPKVKDESRDSH